MKKSLKLTMTTTMIAALTVGTAMTALAAGGWRAENGSWHYYDNDGYYVTDTWKKNGTENFYLDEDGYVATNRLIEDGDNLYAVDANGFMVKNAWRELMDEDGEYQWYYFQSTGKAKKDGFLTVDGEKYHFTDGKMDAGWLEDGEDTYFLNLNHDGTYGRVMTGWVYYDGSYDMEYDYDEVEEGWYYFGTNGKMVSNTERKINDLYYAFNEDGLMLDNWVEFNVATSSDASASSTVYKYYRPSEGDRVSGWRYLDEMDEEDGLATEEGWYYFKAGVPYTATYKTTPIADGYGVAKINGKVYCFDDLGLMVMGKVTGSNGEYFYFSEDINDGSMKSGRVEIRNSEDLEDGTYYFADAGSLGEKGASFTGVKKGYLYDNGELVCADDGMKYELVTVAGKQYLVSEAGKVKTSGTVKDGDGIKWTVTKDANGDYIITKTVE